MLTITHQLHVVLVQLLSYFFIPSLVVRFEYTCESNFLLEVDTSILQTRVGTEDLPKD